MPSGKSAYLRNQVLNENLGGAAWTAPGTVYIALSTALWAAATTGATLTSTEPSTGGYGRVAVTNDTTTWPTTTTGAKSNGIDISFGGASVNWGTIQSFYIVDALTNGNILYGGDLYTPRAINAGDTAKFLVGQLTVTEA